MFLPQGSFSDDILGEYLAKFSNRQNDFYDEMRACDSILIDVENGMFL